MWAISNSILIELIYLCMQFILDEGHLSIKDGSISIKNLVNLWSSSPENIENTQRAHLRDACWYLVRRL